MFIQFGCKLIRQKEEVKYLCSILIHFVMNKVKNDNLLMVWYYLITLVYYQFGKTLKQMKEYVTSLIIQEMSSWFTVKFRSYQKQTTKSLRENDTPTRTKYYKGLIKFYTKYSYFLEFQFPNP